MVDLPFLAAVAIAGGAFLVGDQIVGRVAWLRRHHVPAPIVGGALAALGFWILRSLGEPVNVPTGGAQLDFLIGLISTNMGLHVTPKALRRGLPVLGVFLLAAVLLFFVQLAIALPLAWLLTDAPLATGILAAPYALLGSPFSLSPPNQVPLTAALFQDVYPDVAPVAKGAMMVGVLASLVLPFVLATRLAGPAADGPPAGSPEARSPPGSVWGEARSLGQLLALVLLLIVLAFALQRQLREVFPSLQQDHVPVILLSYLLGAITRIAWSTLAPKATFPKEALSMLLLGPTMAIVLTYAVMSVPLHFLAELPPAFFLVTPLAIGLSVLAALGVHRAALRFLEKSDAQASAVVFLGLATAWGPFAMAYLRRWIDEEGAARPVPVFLPLSAFYLFPWTTVLLTRFVLSS